MNETLERLRKLARSGLNSVRTGFERARAFAGQACRTGMTRAREGWASFRDSWAKTDWTAGIEPLPPGMASHLAAIGIVTGLVVTSLVYGDHYQRQAWEQRLIPSGEHPSQQDAPISPDAEPVPESDTPEATPAPSAGPVLPQQGEAFVERFDRDAIDDRWVVADGWSNGSWMANDWRRSSLGIKPNLLTLNLEKGPEGSDYELASGELQTHARHRYGYFEIRMKVPRGSGLVTGFFTYAGRSGGQRPNEIDIEILGRNTRVVELTIHENNRPTSKKVTLPFDAADGFHTYGFDWQPGHVRWYADGQLIHSETGGAAQRLVRPQQLFLNLWSSKELHAWVGRLDTNRAPWKLEVACMAYAPTYAGALCN
jgi:endo-1,3-1,4-beta-glycanase ExoK